MLRGKVDLGAGFLGFLLEDPSSSSRDLALRARLPFFLSP